MRHPYYLLAIPMTSFALVVGIGIWSLNHTQTNKPIDPSIAQPYIHPTSAQEESYTLKLNRALQKTRQARAFHVDVSHTEPGQSFTSNIEYVRPFRLSATITFNQDDPIKTVIVGKTVYTQTESDDWQMSNRTDLQQFGDAFFKEMSEGPASLVEFGLQGADPTISKDKSNQCTNYQFNRIEPPAQLHFCIDDTETLKYLQTKKGDTKTRFTFSRLNDFFIIERPALPLLERKIRLEQTDSNE